MKTKLMTTQSKSNSSDSVYVAASARAKAQLPATWGWTSSLWTWMSEKGTRWSAWSQSSSWKKKWRR